MPFIDKLVDLSLDVLIAIAVVVAIGAIFGALLALINYLFGIEDDKTVKEVRAVLPGINCGACGFKGCNDYAEALARGEAKPNLCIPGAEAVAEDIGAILGIAVEPIKDVIAFVHCNGVCGAAADKAIYLGPNTCRAAGALFGGPKACSFGCIGCGDCAKVCVSNAINIINGVAVVDTSLCVGCGVCASHCPKKLISMIPQEATAVVYCSSHAKGADARKACKNACIGCKKCEKLCPGGAITVVNNCAEIDYSKCTGCGACISACPTGCLKGASFPDLPEGFRLKQ